ncbi:hypothetical protein ACRWQN_11370 [Shewanella sp. HL-SH8]|uniref:hypothetical protein n=1 Tax=Shewanella sp. HL-SH8 TaxID=3436242 RepID=UPI003EC054C1
MHCSIMGGIVFRLPFKELIKNGANNGADLFAIDAKSPIIWLVEVKSSIRDRFPDPSKLNLEKRGWDWIEAAANSGKIAGKTVEPEGIAYAQKLLDLRLQGYVIKPMLAKVSVPAAGSSGVARVTITAAK